MSTTPPPGLRERTDARTVDDAAPASGPSCSACGTRNDDGAKFCDSCGAALVH